MKFCWWRDGKELLRHNLFSKIFILKRPGVAIFADIIKIESHLLKQSLKTQEKLRELEIIYLNEIYICIS